MITAAGFVIAILLVQYARIAIRQNRRRFAIVLCSIAILCVAGALRLDADLVNAITFYVLSRP